MHDDALQPWTVLTSRHVHRDRWIAVRADECRSASGALIAPYYVLEYPDWVHVVALDHNDLLLLTRQYRQGDRSVSLELPCGTIDPSYSTPEAAARRELLEETGCTGTFEPVGRFSPNPATHNNSI